MRRFAILFIFFLIHTFVHAQIGINGAYKSIHADIWEMTIQQSTPTSSNQSKYFQNAYSFGVDYWFRLKNKRIEFTPELAYSAFKSRTFNYHTSLTTQDLNTKFFSFMFNTNVYLFDFKGDCNCPTFSKDGDALAKGFFIQVSPGISFIQENHLLQFESEGIQSNTSTVAPSLALGVGVDIGLSDFLTITPYAKVQRHFNANWEDFNNLISPTEPLFPENEISNIDHLQVGLRIGLRFDELNKYGFR